LYQKSEESKCDKIDFRNAETEFHARYNHFEMQLLDARKHIANLQGSNAPNWNVQKLRKENEALIAKVDDWKKEVASVKVEYLQLFNAIKPNRLKNKETAESLEKKLDALISKNANYDDKLQQELPRHLI